ncbi:MAG: 50S ribosomal protein L22 [Flavobacteriales bacterium]|jgi:large subunit ribosomal protein L22|uniref:large ribosomal subunit protein uL22 n=1 Tax=Blattabacterium sp. (Mastotermes darwiniensis) TaxID=39768 RepID=UPI000231DE6E|nr:uL22 family ribosomal protein [Blattabacterium sp. (Mastotermes darwiniensis)]AER40674.1 50S ribosomal protein L22 [Blattabacterium sp. (Mastotermes darwiniensis) str. MADAR]MDR1804798.1 50S ribosomal protein L22 [Flavobacteriales bacterium]
MIKKDAVKDTIVSASLNGIRSSPRKMRLVVNIIRNKSILKSLDILKYSSKHKITIHLRKLLLSLLSNYRQKYMEDSKKYLYIKEIMVNQGKTLKRLRPVPQGRGHRIRKRSSNVLVVLGIRNGN